jgi:hypothetical protein
MRHVLDAGLMALLLTPAAMDVCAQTAGTTTTIGVSVVELNDVINGWSVQHQLLGVCVYNDKDEKIGKIEDIILNKERSAMPAARKNSLIDSNCRHSSDDAHPVVRQGYASQAPAVVPC